MIMRFKTKPDVNGNVNVLVIDTIKEVWTQDALAYPDDIVIKKRDMTALINDLVHHGFAMRLY